MHRLAILAAWLLLAAGACQQAVFGWQVERTPPANVRTAKTPAPLRPSSGADTSSTATGPGSIELPSTGDASSAPERIARLQRAVQSDLARLDELKCQLEDPEGEYSRAESRFNELDARLAERKREYQQAGAEADPEAVRARLKELSELEKTWGLARQEFQLALEKRKAQQASIATLETKIEKDRLALERLRGNTVSTPASAPQAEANAQPPAGQAAPAAPAPGDSPPPSIVPPTHPLAPFVNPETKPNGDSSGARGGQPPAANQESAAPARQAPDKQVDDAKKEAAESEEAARQAEEAAASLTERLEILRQDIDLQRKLRTFASKKKNSARDQLVASNENLERAVAAGEDVAPIRRQIRQAEVALVEAQDEAERIAERLDELQTELNSLQEEQLSALHEAEEKRQAAERAQKAVEALSNPFSPRNLWRWAVEHGSTILIVLAALVVVLWLGRLLEGRVVSLIALRGARGNREEREKRARTLVSVLHNMLRTAAFGVAIVKICDELGVPLGPILGGAAVLGLAVAFGAQSLIKDYFTGFMVLLEQQYMIGDVVQIGATTAQVERITLRMTILRDLQGRVHFIPHGQINTVTNLTHEWSRAVLEIGVAYKEDVDRVIEILLDLGRGLRNDVAYAPLILEDPEMLGVDAFGDSGVVIKFMIKTRPLKQWMIKRELLRRIKKRFDELGIEIPFPHRMLYFAPQAPAGLEGPGPAASFGPARAS